MRLFLFIVSVATLLNAHSGKVVFAKKGQKVASIFCNQNKLPSSATSVQEAISKIKESKACKNLDSKKLQWVAYYILNKHKISNSKSLKITVPNGAKCPVCGMFVYKYPKWVAQMVIDGKNYYFDGVKDMMKYYFFDGDFPYDRAKISQMLVTNYYTLKAIKAKDAFYVYDSKVYGPMGRELIAFTTKKEAQNFITDHGGELIYFKDITPKNILALDGIDFDGN